VKRIAATLAISAAALSACTTIGVGQQAVKVDSWGAPEVNGCAGESSTVSWFGNDVYRFPARQITWDANNEPGAERGPYTAMSKPASPPLAPGVAPDDNFSTGQAEMAIPVTITFDLTTDCDKLKDFYRDYATQDSGWIDKDTGTSEGWVKLLTRVISQPADQAVIVITQRYPWQKVWNNEAVRKEYVDALQSQLPKETAARTGGVEYFKNFRVTVGKPYPTSEELRKNAELIQTNQAAADAKRTQLTADADAQKAAAESQRAAAVAQKDAEIAKAQIVAAQIAGYPDVESYLRAMCIEKAPNCTPWPQPIIAGAR
jgi:hypothetical protein